MSALPVWAHVMCERPILGTSAFLSCVVLTLASYKRHLTTDPDFKSSSFVLVTSTSIIGCGAIFKLPPFLRHCCNWDVHVNLLLLTDLLWRHRWLQNPTLPAMQKQQALTWCSPMLLFDVHQCSPVFVLLNIVYFSVCLTSNKLYWIEGQLADVSTRFYTSVSWRPRVDWIPL